MIKRIAGLGIAAVLTTTAIAPLNIIAADTTGGDGYLYNLNWWTVNSNGSDQTKGDLNADRSFDINDLKLLQKFILGKTAELPDWTAGDMNDDGVLDSFDLALMRRALA